MNNDTDDEKVFSTSVCVRSGKAGGGGDVLGRKSLLALISFFLFFYLRAFTLMRITWMTDQRCAKNLQITTDYELVRHC